MAKYFNTTGVCRPSEHYMVSLDGRLAEIRRMIDRKYYFSINRGRQYGKTTTLAALKHFLRADFIVASLDFQFLSQADFASDRTFSAAFARRFALALPARTAAPAIGSAGTLSARGIRFRTNTARDGSSRAAAIKALPARHLAKS